MLYDRFRALCALPGHIRLGTRTKVTVMFACLALISSLLAACGSSATAVQSRPSPAPTHIIRPTPSPVVTPTPVAKPVPIRTPAPVQGAPAILDLRPLSMSLVGHLDCQKNGAFVCLARVLSGSNNQSNLHWTAFTNVPGHIVFSPSSGVLAPGQSVLVTITVPFTACTPGLFFFQGPVNTHTITWAC